MSNYSPKNLLNKEPVVIGGTVTILLQLAVLLNLVTLSVQQVTGITAGVVAVLALLTRSQVTPSSKVIVSDDDMDEFGNVYPFRP